MKNLLLVASFILAIYSRLFAGEPFKPGLLNNVSINAEYTSAVIVSQSEWNSLTAAFQSQNANTTWGGSLNKTDLQTLLSAIPASNTLVYFRFVTDETYNQTSVEFSGGKTAQNVTCIRNGGSPNAFCPTACNLKSPTCPRAIQLSYQNYNSLSAGYQENHPDSTFGGNIDKLALQNIINSLPKETTTINFRFCTDPAQGKTSIIFMGGAVDQPQQLVLYLRNGLTAESFCPTNCNAD